MKVSIANFCVVIILFFNTFCLEAQTGNKNKIVYGAYCAGYTIKNVSYLSKMNFSDFDFYYLMAFYNWNSKDFDMSLDDILKKYVADFIYPNSTKSFGLTEQFIDFVHSSNGKVLLSLHSSNFIDIAKSENRRNNFAIMIAEFIKKHNYDGFDLDWEVTLDIDLHYLFLKKVKEVMGGDKQSYITTALPTGVSYSQALADSLSQVVDWINLMTYDLGGGIWGVIPTANTSMLKIENSLIEWKVFPSDKICIGLASYGYKYMNLKPGQRIANGIKMDTYGSYINYPAILDSLQAGWTEHWDSQELVPYYYSPNGHSFITADNPHSIEYKVQWALSHGYKGLFWWELYQDFVIKDPNDKYGDFLLKDITIDFIKQQQQH